MLSLCSSEVLAAEMLSCDPAVPKASPLQGCSSLQTLGHCEAADLGFWCFTSSGLGSPGLCWQHCLDKNISGVILSQEPELVKFWGGGEKGKKTDTPVVVESSLHGTVVQVLSTVFPSQSACVEEDEVIFSK